MPNIRNKQTLLKTVMYLFNYPIVYSLSRKFACHKKKKEKKKKKQKKQKNKKKKKKKNKKKTRKNLSHWFRRIQQTLFSFFSRYIRSLKQNCIIYSKTVIKDVQNLNKKIKSLCFTS